MNATQPIERETDRPGVSHIHFCIVSLIASPCGIMVGYERDALMFKEYGGMRFDYCPLCGKRNGGA
jgi:hypothetical protein